MHSKYQARVERIPEFHSGSINKCSNPRCNRQASPCYTSCLRCRVLKARWMERQREKGRYIAKKGNYIDKRAGVKNWKIGEKRDAGFKSN